MNGQLADRHFGLCGVGGLGDRHVLISNLQALVVNSISVWLTVDLWCLPFSKLYSPAHISYIWVVERTGLRVRLAAHVAADMPVFFLPRLLSRKNTAPQPLSPPTPPSALTPHS